MWMAVGGRVKWSKLSFSLPFLLSLLDPLPFPFAFRRNVICQKINELLIIERLSDICGTVTQYGLCGLLKHADLQVARHPGLQESLVRMRDLYLGMHYHMVKITFFFLERYIDFYILACSKSIGTDSEYDCYVPVMVIRCGPTSTFKVTNLIDY
jgi:hypothetical protein